MGVDPAALRRDLEGALPQATDHRHGPSAGAGLAHAAASRVLEAADREARRMKDEYVSVEHLLVALAEEGSATVRAGCSPATASPATPSWPR